MKITDVYARLKRENIVRSQWEFSIIWLNRSPRYYSHLIAVDREPGVATLIGLADRIRKIGSGLSLERRDRLLSMAEQIDANCRIRAVTDLHRRGSLAAVS